MWELDFIRAIQESAGTNDALSRIMQIFTLIGDGGLIWLLLGGIFLIFKKTRKMGISTLICWASLAILNEFVIKNIVQRTRPINLDSDIGRAIKDFASPWLLPPHSLPLSLFSLPHEASNSFMSGHTAMSFASAFAIFWNSKKWGWPAFILAGLISFSRIYFGVHWVTDVIGGMVLSTICAFTICILCDIGLRNFKIWNDKRKLKKDSQI